MAGITLSKIDKSFDETVVLRGVDLDVRDGEFLTLVGPSGCGKSTLLRIIAGLEAQTSGDVRIGQRLVNAVRASDRDLAMVFQSYALYPHLSVLENMMTPLRLRDLTMAQRLPLVGRFLPGAAGKLAAIRRQARETAEILKIQPLLERKPGQLSGGQRQRAALGRAMVRRPVAFLMDEPLSNLDAALRVHMRAELTELHRRLNTTFVYVTHDQAEALTMSSRVAVMMDGEILQLDTPHEIYVNPANRRVAEFVGSPKINILPGRLDASGRVTVLGRVLQARLSTAGPREVSVGLRPEHLQATAVRTDAEQHQGQVRLLEHLGSDVYVHATLSDSGQTVVVRSDPDASAELSYGATVFISQTRAGAFVFDERGERLRIRDAEQTGKASDKKRDVA
jgi:multiple sugar transport system ATP-binding protein